MRLALGAVAVSLLPLCAGSGSAAESPQPAEMPRIGVLGAQVLGPGPDEAFRDGLRQLGYVEGKSIAIEFRGSQAPPEQLHAGLNEMYRRAPFFVDRISGDLALATCRSSSPRGSSS